MLCMAYSSYTSKAGLPGERYREFSHLKEVSHP